MPKQKKKVTLYEFTTLIKSSFVVAAESEEVAKEEIAKWSAAALCQCGDIAISDGPELFDIREVDRDKVRDLSHAELLRLDRP